MAWIGLQMDLPGLGCFHLDPHRSYAGRCTG